MKHSLFGKIFTLLFLTISFSALAQNWTQLPNFPGSSRDDGAGFVIGNYLYAGTGLDAGFNATRDFYKLNLQTETWSAAASMPTGSERQYASGCSVGNYGYLFGGIGPNSTYLNDLWKYDPSNSSWTSLAPLPGPGRRGTAVFCIGNELYITGGHNAVQGTLQDMWKYSISTNTWTSLGTFPFSSFWRAGSCALNGVGYVMGGFDSSGTAIDKIFSYVPATNTWYLFTQFSILQRGYFQLLPIGGSLFFYGGYNPVQGYFGDMYAYDFQLGAFIPFNTFPLLARRGYVAGVWNNTLYFTTGLVSTPARTVETWKVNSIVGIEEPKEDHHEIFPNPFHDFLEIPLQSRIEIYTIDGRLVLQSNFNEKKVNTSSLASGSYLIRLTDTKGNSTTQLLICNGN